MCWCLVVLCQCVPYALSWGKAIVAGGNDRRVCFYDNEGSLERTFDYTSELDVKVPGCHNPVFAQRHVTSIAVVLFMACVVAALAPFPKASCIPNAIPVCS